MYVCTDFNSRQFNESFDKNRKGFCRESLDARIKKQYTSLNYFFKVLLHLTFANLTIFVVFEIIYQTELD